MVDAEHVHRGVVPRFLFQFEMKISFLNLIFYYYYMYNKREHKDKNPKLVTVIESHCAGTLIHVQQ